ncbi:MAG: precorrin-4 C(11)-methyltransferase, partial [Prevotellaceae bacterium]|nr:precorrin-4 C(11)-methyltransferase [Prevotellaceae bacterium]
MITYESVNEKGRALCLTIERELGDEWRGDALVFVGALGICVRRVMPTLRGKHEGQAVVCVDSTGRYVIPVVGGHAGGANELARRIARITGGEAVITTQSDNLGLWALDTLAGQCGWSLRAPEDINREIAIFVGGEPTALVLEHRDEHTLRL